MGKRQLVAIVGGSHDGHLKDELLAREAQIFSLTSPGWRISVETVVNTLGCLSPAPDVLLVQYLDNYVYTIQYFCKGENGSLTLPVKSWEDNKYNVEGELRLASREEMVSILNLIKPILVAIPMAKVVLITCLPRYLHQPCCKTDGHLVNLDENKLLSELATMKRAIRSFLFSEKLKNVSIIDHISVCAVMEMASYRDAVHLTWLQRWRTP